VAAGHYVSVHYVLKQKAKSSLQAQELRGSATSSKTLSMLPQSDHPAPPAALIHMLELTKAFYSESLDRIDKYMEFSILFLHARVHSRFHPDRPDLAPSILRFSHPVFPITATN
jgi:hypothetical protein